MPHPGAQVRPWRPSFERFADIRYIQIIVNTAIGRTIKPMAELVSTRTESLNACSLIAPSRNRPA